MAISADLIVETGLSPSLSVASDGHLLSRLAGQQTETRPVLRIYTLKRSSVLLGRYQPLPADFPPDALQKGAAERIGRRLTGGRAVPAGPGFLGISLVLPKAWDLAGDPGRILPPELVLNRYVRGVMRGCHSFSVRAVYLGRDFLTVNRKKIALVGFTFSEGGAVLFECHLALSGDLSALDPSLAALPFQEHFLSSLPASPVTSLSLEGEQDVSVQEMAEAVCKGSEIRLGLTFEERSWTPEERERFEHFRKERMEGSGWLGEGRPRPSETRRAETEIQLGRFSAALATDEEGNIASVTLSGDFLSDDRTIQELEGAFCGQPCEWTALGGITDRILNRPDRFILGLGSRRVIPDTLMKAVR